MSETPEVVYPDEVYHEDRPNDFAIMEDGTVIRNMSAEEYWADYAANVSNHGVPAEYLETS